ncbi:MAG: hypothetical protein KA055_03515 [Aliarcobacter sp.]|nr:hypothetical protein [Aliarcobacter sp.]
MKKMIVFCSLSIFAFGNSDYIPLSEMSQKDKIEHNFLKKQIETQVNEDRYKAVEKINTVKKVNITKEIEEKKHEVVLPIKEEEIKETIIKNDVSVEEKIIIEEKNIVDKEFVKEYKKDNILKNSKKQSAIFNNSDFSVTPKISYMHVTTDIEKVELDKSHEIMPEISLVYKNHTLKADYFGVNTKIAKIARFDTNWYKLAYLYNFENAKIGIGYNHYRNKASVLFLGPLFTTNENFPTLEIHMKNSQNNLIVEYGGFYGKNDSFIKNAYEYYLSLGYKIFDNDNLIFTAGYKNRTLDLDTGAKLEYKGPTIGISSTF